MSLHIQTDYLIESVELKLDKYIVKPFTSKKLYELLMKLETEFNENSLIELPKGAKIDTIRNVIMFDGKEFPLTYREIQMLKILADKKAITYEELHNLWSETPTDNAVRSFVKQLRKKLPEGLIKVRSRIGYVLEGN